MAKTLRLRPSWICLRLCKSDTRAAILLAEIIYRAVLTKYKNGDNAVLAYSFDEWADITGLSRNQVRRALELLASLRIVLVYNKVHPHKGALRALHIEVPQEVRELFHYLGNGEYTYEKEILCLSTDNTCDIRLSLSHQSTSACQINLTPICQIDVSSVGTPGCGQEASPLYKEDNKNDSKAAMYAGTETIEENKKGSKESKESKESKNDDPIQENCQYLREIITLPNLLIQLNDRYLHYYADKLFSNNGYKLGKMWSDHVALKYGKYVKNTVSSSEYIVLGYMADEIGWRAAGIITGQAPLDWAEFTNYVRKHESIAKVPPIPEIVFLYTYRKHAMTLWVSKPEDSSDAA